MRKRPFETINDRVVTVMNLKYNLHKLRNAIIFPIFLFRNLDKERFRCPICGYNGPLKDINPASGFRLHAKCPKCDAVERHRVQYLAMDKVLNGGNSSARRMLHFAPEPFFRDYFSKHFNKYETADLNMKGVDYNIDMQEIPFESESFDFVFASHVLEHIVNDKSAIDEISRILKPNGIAIFSVPIVAVKTIEYPWPIPSESGHVRAPGYDYFDRFKQYFSRVEIISSDSLPGRYQPYIYENRNQWPSKACPLRFAMKGKRHIEIVAVCYV